jgi:Zn-dependent membrane protease YugP
MNKEMYNTYVPVMAMVASFGVLFILCGTLLFKINMILVGVALILIPVIISIYQKRSK